MSPNLVPITQTSVAPVEALQDAWLAMIERAAKDPAVDIAKLERMLELRSQEHARLAAQKYRESMSACQAAMQAIRTDAINTHAGNAKYATLAAVDAVARPIYTAHGFALSFDTDDCAKENHVRVVCRVHHAAGHAEHFHIDMPCDGKGAKGNAVMTMTHAVASAISYARRYLLSMVFSLCIERDDDGNAAGRRQEPAPARQPPRPAPGKRADGQDNRFYREPPHDPQTGEVIEDPAQQEFVTLREAMRRINVPDDLYRWGQENSGRVQRLSPHLIGELQGFYKSRMAALKQVTPEAAE
jgi:ERF superfamily